MYIHINTQVRVLMYLKFNAKLSQLTDTFVNIAGTLLQFLVIWFVTLCAFVLMAHLVFGDRIAAFGSFQAALNEVERVRPAAIYI